MAENTEKGSNNRKSVRTWFIATPIVLLLFLGALAMYRSGVIEGSVSQMPTFEVREGPLLISVTESGTINAREQEVIKSEVEGQTQVLWLVAEGERVKKGDLLVRLDSSRLEDQMIDLEIVVQNAEADFIDARESLAVVNSQVESDINAAELAFQFAKEDLTKYVEGDFPNQSKEAQAKKTLAEAELASAAEDLRGNERLFEKNFVTSIELDTAKRFKQRAELDLELAIASMELLKGFTYERMMTQLESDLEETEMALERAKLKGAADRVQAEASFKAENSEYEREQSKLEKLKRQISKTELYAPTDGLVVYATTSQGRGPMSSQEPLEEGQMVRERQELIHLPTASSVMIRASIHESNLAKVHAGQGVRITVDALPDKVFTGHIAHIAPLPDAQSMWMNPDLKVYNTEIYIDGDGSDLWTGMSCRAQIMVEHYESAVYVPVQSIVLVKGKPFVFVVEDQEVEQRHVEVGLDNNRMIRIVANLNPGEHVLLTPPIVAESEDDFSETDDVFVEPSETVPSQPQTVEHEPGPRGAGRPGEGMSGGGMSPEQREEMRKRFENMSPEEREQMRTRMRSGGMRQGGESAAPNH